MTTKQEFIQKSLDERSYLKMIFDKLPTEYDYKTFFTPAEGYDVYDGLLMRFEKGTSRFIDRFIIEIKVRDKFYPELLLESIKLNSLKKERTIKDKKTNSECYTNTKSRLVYISVTPEGSYWFDLDKIEDSLVWTEQLHWASTTDKSQGKVMKKVAMVDCKLAKRFDIKTGDLKNNKDVFISRLLVNHNRNKQMAGFII